MDCHATLLEFEKDRNYLLNTGFNTIGIGLAYDKDKVVVVNLYSQRLVTIEVCSMIEETQTIYLEGKLLNEKHAVFAIRIVEESNQNKTLLSLTPQDLYYDNNSKKWNCKFKNVGQVFQDIDNNKRLFIQVYLIKEKPQNIKYGEPFSAKINYTMLVIGFRSQLFHFPHPLVTREQERIDLEDKDKQRIEEQNRKDEESAERLEKNRRENRYLGADVQGLAKIREESENESDQEDSQSNKLDSTKRLDKSVNSREKENSFLMDRSMDDKREPYDDKLQHLEKTLDQLKRENDEIQRNIALLFEFKKIEMKEDKKHYKESNINESTYHDTLTTAANLYNDLHTHRTKLNADLSKYDQSIKIQEERKKEVYKILMNYKEELINNAEDRKGAKIPPRQIEIWLATEKQYEEELRKLRIDNIKSTLKLNRINKELKKTEEYFEGLHYIDFEQLKIENNVSLYIFIKIDFNRKN